MTFNTSETLHIIIRILTVVIIMIIITAEISLGIEISMLKITAFVETHAIFESNTKIVLDRRVASFKIAESYFNNSQEYLISKN
jgi:hypothetical protein